MRSPGSLYKESAPIRTAATGTRQLISQTEVVNPFRQGLHCRRIRTLIQQLVLFPRLPHQSSCFLEVIPQDGVVHIHGVTLHLFQQVQVTVRVQEHALHNLRQDALGCTRNARVIQQMALAVLVACEQVIRQPAHLRFLMPSRLRLQQLHPVQHTSVLILPAAPCGEQLFQYQRTAADALLVPVQAAEIIQRP